MFFFFLPYLFEVCNTMYFNHVHYKLIKPRIFNISKDSSLNIASLLLPHLSQIVERTNNSFKMHGILGF